MLCDGMSSSVKLYVRELEAEHITTSMESIVTYLIITLNLTFEFRALRLSIKTNLIFNSEMQVRLRNFSDLRKNQNIHTDSVNE